MNAITLATSQPKSSLSLLPDRATQDLEAIMRNRLERGPSGSLVIAEGRGPTPAQVSQLEQRRAAVVQALTPAHELEIANRVSGLIIRFPSTRVPDEASTTAAYIEDLRAYPLWAIDQGTRRFLASRKGYGAAFMPSSPELAEAVREVVAPLEAEATSIGRILAASRSGSDSAMRKKVGAAVGWLAGSMRAQGYQAAARGSTLVKREDTISAAEAALAELASKPPVVGLSASALRTCGVEPPSFQEAAE